MHWQPCRRLFLLPQPLLNPHYGRSPAHASAAACRRPPLRPGACFSLAPPCSRKLSNKTAKRRSTAVPYNARTLAFRAPLTPAANCLYGHPQSLAIHPSSPPGDFHTHEAGPGTKESCCRSPGGAQYALLPNARVSCWLSLCPSSTLPPSNPGSHQSLSPHIPIAHPPLSLINRPRAHARETRHQRKGLRRPKQSKLHSLYSHLRLRPPPTSLIPSIGRLSTPSHPPTPLKSCAPPPRATPLLRSLLFPFSSSLGPSSHLPMMLIFSPHILPSSPY